MSNTTLQKILIDIQNGNLKPAENAIENFKIHTKQQRDELYALSTAIMSISSSKPIPGGYELAVKGYEKILAWDSDDKDASINLCVILMKWSDLVRVRDILEALIVKYPEDLTVNINLGTVYLRAHQNNKALNQFNKCLKIDPDNAACYNALASIFLNMKEDKLAIDYFRKTINLEPLHKTAYMNLATLLYNYGHKEEAYKTAEIAAKISPSDPRTYYTIASLQYKDTLLSEAAEMCKIALSIEPNHSDSKLLLSRILNIKGQLEDSKNTLGDIRNNQKNDPSIFLSQLNLDKKPLSEKDKEILLKLINSDTLSDSKLVVAYMALSRSSEFDKDYDNEIAYIRKANELKRRVDNYSFDTANTIADKVINRYTEEFLNNQVENNISDLQPIFIIGLPRSGSTLTEQIISSHPMVSGIGETGYIGDMIKHSSGSNKNTDTALNRTLAQQYIEMVKKEHSTIKPIFTDKTLSNFFHVALLKLSFPNAKFIHCKRHPVDNCLGMFKQIFSDNALNFTNDFESIVEFYQAYQKVIAHWHTVMPGTVYDSQYENLVNNPEEEARKLIAYCGLPWDDACLRFYENKRDVTTASILQVRQPIYKTAVAKWKRYEPYVQDLITQLTEAGIKL